MPALNFISLIAFGYPQALTNVPLNSRTSLGAGLVESHSDLHDFLFFSLFSLLFFFF